MLVYWFRILCRLVKNESSLNLSPRDKKIIISLTTISFRIQKIHQVCLLMLNQTLRPDKIVIYIGAAEFAGKKLPLMLRLLTTHFGVEVRYVEDIGPHTKYYYAMLDFPNDLILTVDDDVKYPEDLIQELFQSYLAYPNAISARRGHCITFDRHGKIAKYQDWIYQSSHMANTPSMRLFATGAGGVIYPPGLMHKDFQDLKIIKKLCLKQDDVWLKFMQVLVNTPVVLTVPFVAKHVKGSQKVSLNHSNVRGGGNDNFIDAVLGAYNNFLVNEPTLLEKIKAAPFLPSPRKQKVLISILQFNKSTGGTLRNVHEQIRHFLHQGCEVHVISETIDMKEMRKMGVHPHMTWRWPMQNSFRRKFYDRQVQQWIKKNRPQLVIGHGDLSNQDVLCLHNSIHLAHEQIHQRPLPTSAEMYPIHTPQLKNKKFKLLIANSNLMKHDLVQRFGIPETDIKVVYPAYDQRKFFPLASERSATRAQLAIGEHEFAVGLITSGNFIKRGIDVYLEAVQRFPADLRSKYKFFVVGNDIVPGADGNIRQLPVRKDVENYFRALDLFVLPARFEEFGRVQLEAMAIGLPVISTEQVGASELLSGRAAEFVMPKADSQLLVEAILKVGESDALAKDLSALSISLARPCAEESLGSKFEEAFAPFMQKNF